MERPGSPSLILALHGASDVDRGFFDAAQPIHERYGQGHTGPAAPTRDAVDPPYRKRFEADGRFERVAVHQWDWDQTYSAPDYRKLMLSYSGTQMMADEDRMGLLGDMKAFITETFDGRVTRPLVAALTTAVLTGSQP